MVDHAGRALLATLAVLGGCTGAIGDDLAAVPSGETVVMVPTPTLPGSGAAPALRPELPPGACAPPSRRIWKLTPHQLTATLRSLVPGAVDIGRELTGTLPPSAHPFSNVASRQEMSQPHVDQLLEVSERVAASALKERAKLLPCLATTLDSMCLRTFVGTFGAKAFRRPLSVDEIDGYLSYFDR